MDKAAWKHGPQLPHQGCKGHVSLQSPLSHPLALSPGSPLMVHQVSPDVCEPSWRVQEAACAANRGTTSFPSKSPVDSSVKKERTVHLADGSENEGDFKEGDTVLLGDGVPAEFRQHVAVITKTAATHCTVIVLDKSERFGMGECWPMLTDLQLKSRLWRLGRHVVIDGLHGTKGKRLNGCRGVICSHPSQGHPAFVHSKAHPEQPHLVVCVYLDEPPTGADHSVLLEPRFLAQQCP